VIGRTLLEATAVSLLKRSPDLVPLKENGE
jgi:hypothetical protein